MAPWPKYTYVYDAFLFIIIMCILYSNVKWRVQNKKTIDTFKLTNKKTLKTSKSTTKFSNSKFRNWDFFFLWFGFVFLLFFIYINVYLTVLMVHIIQLCYVYDVRNLMPKQPKKALNWSVQNCAIFICDIHTYLYIS